MSKSIYLNSSTPEHTEVPPTGHATHGILHILSCSPVQPTSSRLAGPLGEVGTPAQTWSPQNAPRRQNVGLREC